MELKKLEKFYTNGWLVIHVGVIVLLIGKAIVCNAFPPILEPHPRNAEEIQKDIDDDRYQHTREILDAIDRDRAPHSTDDAKNFANRN